MVCVLMCWCVVEVRGCASGVGVIVSSLVAFLLLLYADVDVDVDVDVSGWELSAMPRGHRRYMVMSRCRCAVSVSLSTSQNVAQSISQWVVQGSGVGWVSLPIPVLLQDKDRDKVKYW